MQTGKFPASYKQAHVLPLLKKPGLDSSSPGNDRPISNLTTVSKVLERLALTRLHPRLLGSANFTEYQSAYRKGHSTETALLEVLDGVYTAADNKQVTVLVGLDLSAAFDTVDRPRDPASAAAVRVWRDRHTAILAPFISERQDLIRQTGSASVTSRRA